MPRLLRKAPLLFEARGAVFEAISENFSRSLLSYMTNPNIRGSHIVSGGQ